RQPAAVLPRSSDLLRGRPCRRGFTRRGHHDRDAERALRRRGGGASTLRRATRSGRAARHADPPPRARPLMAPTFSANPLADLNQLFAYPFMVNALQAGTIVAVIAALVGWFVVLRRESFVCHTLSVMSFPGASGAALAGLPLASGYIAFCVGGAVAIAFGSRVAGRRSLMQESAVVGTVGAVAFGLGFLFLSLYGGILENVETLLFGSFVAITRGQVETLLVVALLAGSVLAVVGRPLFYASVDEQAARADGVPVRALSVTFLVVLALA